MRHIKLVVNDTHFKRLRLMKGKASWEEMILYFCLRIRPRMIWRGPKDKKRCEESERYWEKELKNIKIKKNVLHWKLPSNAPKNLWGKTVKI